MNATIDDIGHVAGANTSGGAPMGMWWVAWRQHRVHALGGLAGIAVIAVAVLVYYEMFATTMHGIGCATGDADVVMSCASGKFGRPTLYDYQSVGTWLGYVLYIAPVLVGAAVGAFVFAREFERGTYVFAFTQSVRRVPWWAVKSAVAAGPVLAGLLVLGFLTQWVNDRTGYLLVYGVPLDYNAFPLRGIMPAAFGLVGIACGLTAGILIRSSLPALLAGVIVAGALVVLVAVPLRPHLLAPSQLVFPLDPINSQPSLGTGDWFLRSGYLDKHGSVIEFDYNNCPGLAEVNQSDPNAGADSDAAIRKCQTQQGFAERFIDYLPAGKAWPLQLVEALICAAISAVILALGALRLRRVPRNRS